MGIVSVSYYGSQSPPICCFSRSLEDVRIKSTLAFKLAETDFKIFYKKLMAEVIDNETYLYLLDLNPQGLQLIIVEHDKLSEFLINYVAIDNLASCSSRPDTPMSVASGSCARSDRCEELMLIDQVGQQTTFTTNQDSSTENMELDHQAHSDTAASIFETDAFIEHLQSCEEVPQRFKDNCKGKIKANPVDIEKVKLTVAKYLVSIENTKSQTVRAAIECLLNTYKDSLLIKISEGDNEYESKLATVKVWHESIYRKVMYQLRSKKGNKTSESDAMESQNESNDGTETSIKTSTKRKSNSDSVLQNSSIIIKNNKEWLVQQHKSTKKDGPRIKKTLATLLKNIKSDISSIPLQKLTEEWPIITESAYFLYLASLCIKNDILQVFSKQIASFQNIIDYFENFSKKYQTWLNKKSICADFTVYCTELNDVKKFSESDDPSIIVLLKMIARYFNEDIKYFIMSIKETSINDGTIDGTVSVNTPIIVYQGDSILEMNGKFWVVIEKKIFIGDLDLLTAIQVAFLSYFVFNMQYQKELEKTFTFIQKKFFEIENEEPLTKSAKKKFKLTVHENDVQKRVKGLMDALESFTSNI